jgi:acetyl esterase/lipase
MTDRTHPTTRAPAPAPRRVHRYGVLAVAALAAATQMGCTHRPPRPHPHPSTSAAPKTTAPATTTAPPTTEPPTTTTTSTTTAPPTTTTPPGPTGVRYRDQVFPSLTTDADLTYGSAPDLAGQPVALKLDLYRPAGDTETRRPAIVFAHGGAFIAGDKKGGLSGPWAQLFAQRGYVTVSINYRLLATAGCGGTNVTDACNAAGRAGIEDGQAAVRWVRANAATYGIDPDRIGIAGESAGGVIATGVGIGSETPGNSGTPGVSSRVSGFVSISGGVPDLTSVDAKDSPGLLFTGTADPIVPYQWSVDTANALTAAGVPSTAVVFEGASHVPYQQYGQQMLDGTVDFFQRTLVTTGA